MNINDLSVIKVGKGFPIIMLHGFPLDHSSLLPLEAYFSDNHKWQRYYIDLPGMGGSRNVGPIKSATDVLDFLIEYIRNEFIGKRFAIVGYSFGGLLATALANKFPDQVKSLFLLAPETVAETGKRALPERTIYHLSPLDKQAKKGEISAYRATVVLESQENFNLFKRYILPGLNANRGNPVLKYLTENPELSKEPGDYLKSYKGGVTIVVGQNDNMVGFQDAFSLYSTLKEAEYVSLQKAGHTLHLDRQEAVGKIFENWLSDLNNRLIF